MEEGEYYGTESVPAPVDAYEVTGGKTLGQSNQLLSHCSESSLLSIMQKMTQSIATLPAASSSHVSRLSMKAPDFFEGTKPFKVRSYIQYCKPIFHKDKENVSEDKNKVLYATLFLIGRASKGIKL
ncbi:hypothetical protein O181_003307 [Austropuccinia psidii MF-1]|uniref:Uncharacterized protein n=1 Tax=Austropuccinia psidii MF-1 TaxID=1389203 RepID=A0A9Q3BEK3_9BASI|nr:hypothetical protein [Austropuccinia psidii MF-1]